MEVNFVDPLKKETLDNMLKTLSIHELKYKYPEELIQFSNRFTYIVSFIAKKADVEINWFDFDNLKENQDGYFDPILYKKEIGLYINFCLEPKYEFDVLNTIPLNYFTESFEDIVVHKINNTIEQYSKRQKVNEEFKNKERKRVEDLISSIKSKLTNEELKVIKFLKIK